MDFDVVVIGAGQAGLEAAHACAKMGRRTLCVTLRLDRIGHLPCNCSIGGPAKGHLAREVDALGGLMGVITDRALTHIRRVGTSKGPAVQTVRAQVCKNLYPRLMGEALRITENLTLMEGLAEWIETSQDAVTGVRILPVGTSEQVLITCKSVVMTTGTFLNGICHEGSNKTVAAREGDQSSIGLTKWMNEIGIETKRFKTGTTPRIRSGSINFGAAEVMRSEPEAGPLSFVSEHISPIGELLPCWQTRTTSATHDHLRDNLHQSAMFSGQIEGVGPRYCPSVEDKVVRFAGKESHPIFLERETWDDDSIYVQGFSTSMPAEVQVAALHTIPGLENAEMIRPGYAVEYDMADPLQLEASLMSRQVRGLFLAGQLNGTSGYEEAAGQGIAAGINAARYSWGEEPVTFKRSNSFIGVMIDDLITKGVDDPYRMLTARAEHRLLLRHDNADQRLTAISREVGLCSDYRWERFQRKMVQVAAGKEFFESVSASPGDSEKVIELGSSLIVNRVTVWDLMKRPEFRLDQAEQFTRWLGVDYPDLSDRQAREQLDLAPILEGYIDIQHRAVARALKLENQVIPDSFDFLTLKGLSFESIEKMNRVKPRTLGQASRIPGVRPADTALLAGHLAQAGRTKA